LAEQLVFHVAKHEAKIPGSMKDANDLHLLSGKSVEDKVLAESHDPENPQPGVLRIGELAAAAYFR
jgi:hypothetical protein